MKKKKELAVIIIFFIIISPVFTIWPLFGKYIDTENLENRNLATMPKLFDSTIYDYSKQLRAYFNDHLPFRNQLIRMNSVLDYYVLNTSSSNNVVLGENGWLFYAAPEDGDPISCYKGTNLLTEEQLKQIAANMITTRDNLAAEGIEFVVFITPNKERIYNEDMPDYYGDPSENYAVLQIYNYLKDNTDINIIYPFNEIKNAALKLGEDTLLYHKTDTHWNELGAYIGTGVLLDELGIDMPSYDSSEITINESEDVPGDLLNLLNLSTIIDPGKTFVPEGYENHEYITNSWNFSTEFRYHANGADPRKIFILRDSFGNAMSDIVGSQFAESVMIYFKAYNNDDVKQEHPDIFVLETTERYAPEFMMNFVYK